MALSKKGNPMIVENLSHNAANEAYTLLSSYIREDGKVGAKYDKEFLKEFVKFLSDILQNPNNFVVKVEEDKEFEYDSGDETKGL